MTIRKAFSAIAIAGALLAGACGCGASAGTSWISSGPRSAASLSWHRCDTQFRCATLSVPLSYSKPSARQIPISVVELVASRPRPLADIVLNPGGPGASGVQYLEHVWSTFPASVRARFNLVSFDPRGVGSSEPLRCLTAAGLRAWTGLDPDPTTQRQLKPVVRASQAFVRGCEKSRSTAFVSSMSTANNAHDMDRLRAALGESRLTYLGFSYGTYLGTVYAEMFPKRIRAMILDGAVDPALDATQFDAGQATGFETDLHDFLAWCAGQSSCASRFPTAPAKAYAALIRRFKNGLVMHTRNVAVLGGREPVDYGTALLGVITALYSKSSWPFLGEALQRARLGDPTDLAYSAYNYAGLQPDGSFENILSANAATFCLDFPTPATADAYETLAAQLAKSAPDFGPAVAWSTLPCLSWPDRAAQPAAAHAPGAPPILVIGSTDDPATPYAWAKALAKQLPRARLLTRTGDGHTSYNASSCIRKWADRYLETRRMPPPGTICPSD